MPRSRGSEPPQRASPRAPLHLKATACSEANGAHHRPAGDRASPKLGDRHSPRSPLPEKKRAAAGTRVAELEAKLGKVQDELKKLREQLASAEAAKKDAQVALEEAKKRVGTKGSPASSATSPLCTPPKLESAAGKTADDIKEEEDADESSVNTPATDVFEVVRAESGNHQSEAEDCEAASCGDGKRAALALADKEQVEEEETKAMIEEESKKASAAEADKESPEVEELKAKLAEKDAEIAALAAENAELKKQAAKKAEEDAAAKAALAERDLKEARMGEQLRASEAAREAVEGDMRRLRVQTEQWRKAAEAAAAVLGGDNHLTGLAGNGNGWGSPATMPDDADDEGFGAKRKGAGIRMLGDLWKKKGNK